MASGLNENVVRSLLNQIVRLSHLQFPKALQLLTKSG